MERGDNIMDKKLNKLLDDYEELIEGQGGILQKQNARKAIHDHVHKKEEKVSGFKMNNTGDIFIQWAGTRLANGKSYTKFRLFEYRENEKHGKGFQYYTSGKSYGYTWAYPQNEYKFQNIPDDIDFSFKHGSHSFYVEDALLTGNETFEEVIRLSDFNFITRVGVSTEEII